MDRAVERSIRVVLVEEVNGPLPVDQSVWVVEPVGRCYKMVARAVGISGNARTVG